MAKRKTILGVPKNGHATTSEPYAPLGCSPPPYELACRMLNAIGWDGTNFRLRDPVAKAIAPEVERINRKANPRVRLAAMINHKLEEKGMKSKKAKAATKRGVVSAPGCSTTPDQFFLQMQKIREEVGDDEEIAHARMDDLMCRVLVELGYRDGVGVFGMQEKWYA